MTRALVAALAASLIAPALSSAATPLPVGESKGVKVERRHGTLHVIFTKRAAKLHKRLAGRLVGFWCTELPDPDELGSVGTGSGGTRIRVPGRRRAIDTGDATGGSDYCRIWRPAHRTGKHSSVGRRMLVSVPLTQRGAVFLDEQTLAFGMVSVLGIAGELGGSAKNTYPTYERLVAWIERGSGSARRFVKLAQPSDTPRAKSVGYYGDGVLHAALVTLSASGRRLFIEVSADRTFYTNVAEYINGDLD